MTKNQMLRIWDSMTIDQKTAAYWYLGKCKEELTVLDLDELIDDVDGEYNIRLHLKSLDNRQRTMLGKLARNSLNSNLNEAKTNGNSLNSSLSE